MNPDFRSLEDFGSLSLNWPATDRWSPGTGRTSCTRQCHAVGAQAAQGDDKTKIAPGINFAIVKHRLRQDYYQRFTLDPPRFDINSKMPKLAADGKTTKVITILDGDARQQFDAVWQFIQQVKTDTK